MLSRTCPRLAKANGIALVGLVFALALAAPASATTTFTVDRTSDESDGNLNDDKCDIAPGQIGSAAAFAPSPALRGCTLRAAIQEANQTSGPDTINFNIPGSGVKTISAGSRLPTLTGTVTIDGYTQPGTRRNTRGIANGNDAVLLIELNGANISGPSVGLQVGTGSISTAACGSVIRGLVLNRFGTAMNLQCDATIEGNFIGTDPGGTIARGNTNNGILVSGVTETAIIGGTSRGARNVISANAATGLLSDRPLIVQGNHIGTKKGGTEPLGNGLSGLRLFGGGNVVGGAGDLANVIAFNHGDGITVFGGVGSRLSRNRIFSNSEQGIDLGANGTTSNDRLDADTGPNNLQNFPSITSAVNTGGQTTIRGVIRSTPNEGFTIELFRNPPGEGEGQKFIGGLTLAANADGERGFGIVTNEVAVGDNITGTATDSQGNTSEFSASPRKVTAGP
jgi:CSLREA domain-containing protein